LARLLPSAVRVRIRSRSTSASPPNTASINRPVLAPVSAHGFGRGSELRLGVRELFDDAKTGKVLRARRSIKIRHGSPYGRADAVAPCPRRGLAVAAEIDKLVVRGPKRAGFGRAPVDPA
jgi:hypothetical protein